ncbi:polysaccharide lyase 6 family protein [Paraflavitalea pollutisoli]|uniref:polysaccharide lyase 6 family protein n=1 Tax=Paraflavitalea pollutisoli TaxID=3034143 RepID=UPI0023EC5765|nr:polysaccharide lyase 6 family protein [Paraflavitalea sp. H1-2-19X]
MYKNTFLRIAIALVITGLLPTTASAKEIVVKTIAALQSAIDKAAPGDVISVAPGDYTTTADIVIRNSGQFAEPITIAAQQKGRTTMLGKGGFRIAGAYIVIRGFVFKHSSDKALTEPGSRFSRWTQNIFETTGEGNYLSLMGSDHQVDYNTFQHKNSLGKFIGVRGEGSQIAERLWIHHNYFFDFLPQTGNGAEAVQFGLSGYSLSSSHSLFENNLFEQCAGENELLSVKASFVTIRYNTIRDCKAQFTLRHGNHCEVYGNYFCRTPGLRIFGDDHIIHSNYFEQCKPAINIGNGGAEVADGADVRSHDRPDRVLIAFNTLVDNEENITRTERPKGIGSTHITIAYNIIQGGGEAVSIQGPLYIQPVWKGNILFKTKGAGQLPDTAFRQIDPLLARDGAGIYHLQKGSPAIGAVAKDDFRGITVDMDGQLRKAPFDAGADQLSTTAVKARVLQKADVGHEAAMRSGDK